MAMMIDAFTDEQINEIATIAAESEIANYSWSGSRGVAPAGYMEGMALTFAQCYIKWKKGDDGMQICAAANTGQSDTDALSWYRGFFDKVGMSNQTAGADTLRHLFVLMLGLGMRESSGEHCCGRDMSASNTTSDSAEAGMFQTSWDINGCSSEIKDLLNLWGEGGQQQCYLPIFRKEVSCSQSNWDSYGSGTGKLHQDTSKCCPPYHAEMTAVGLRKRRQHWGPINRYEVEVLPEADEMFHEVQECVDSWGEQPEPAPGEATVEITITGSVKVIVNGKVVS